MSSIDFKATLGKISKVNPRDVWEDEARHFTPWLADQENLEQLGETLGMELIHESTEEFVGPFRADILCKEADTDHWVLIENQLQRTDHIHLGQVLTYAAGLDAVTSIWISPKFTEEHRGCLDWLNRNTIEGINFFGVEIELWQIGDSQIAPKFNVVSKPNEWVKNSSAAKTRLQSSGRNQIHFNYWQSLMEKLKQAGGPVKAVRPAAQNWMTMSPFNKTGLVLVVSSNLNTKRIRVGIEIQRPEAQDIFDTFLQQRVTLELNLGELDWHDKASKERAIRQYLDADSSNESDWERQHEWLIERLASFYETFAKHVRNLDI